MSNQNIFLVRLGWIRGSPDQAMRNPAHKVMQESVTVLILQVYMSTKVW
jgi:hypothetical protein